MYDVIIIGGGPAGLSAAIFLGRCRKRVLVFDDGRPRNYAARAIHGYLGYDGAPPAQLVANGRVEAARYGAEIVDERVVHAECLSPSPEFETLFRIRAKSGREETCRKLLVATGMRDRLLDIPGLRECYGLSVHHCPYCDGWEHRDEHIVVISSKLEGAVALGMKLRTWSERVTVLTNGESCTAEDRESLARNGVDVHAGKVTELVHNDGRLTHVRFESGESLAAEALFFAAGQVEKSDLLSSLGCDIEQGPHAETGRKQETDVRGLYLAGDAAGDVQFVINAAAEGAKAAVAINHELQVEDRNKA